MPTNLEDWARQSDDAEESGLAAQMKANPSPRGLVNKLLEAERDNGVSAKMPSYIGTKVVCAIPMDEVSFLRTYKNQPDNDNETQPGYLVVYEDGYKSWSPKETFERAYRRITDAERRLI